MLMNTDKSEIYDCPSFAFCSFLHYIHRTWLEKLTKLFSTPTMLNGDKKISSQPKKGQADKSYNFNECSNSLQDVKRFFYIFLRLLTQAFFLRKVLDTFFLILELNFFVCVATPNPSHHMEDHASRPYVVLQDQFNQAMQLKTQAGKNRDGESQ